MHQADGQDVTIDLQGVDFMDSQGLSTLVAAHEQHPGSQVDQLLKMTGLDAYLDPGPRGPLAAAS